MNSKPKTNKQEKIATIQLTLKYNPELESHPVDWDWHELIGESVIEITKIKPTEKEQK